MCVHVNVHVCTMHLCACMHVYLSAVYSLFFSLPRSKVGAMPFHAATTHFLDLPIILVIHRLSVPHSVSECTFQTVCPLYMRAYQTNALSSLCVRKCICWEDNCCLQI